MELEWDEDQRKLSRETGDNRWMEIETERKSKTERVREEGLCACERKDKRDRPGEKHGLMKSSVNKQHQIPISVCSSLLAIVPSLLLTHRWL